MTGFILILVLLLLMWLLLIRPQRRRQLQQQQMINALEVGSEVVTAGGLYGTVTGVDGDDVRLEVADGVEVRVAKRAVAGVVSEEEEEPDELEAAEEPEDEHPG
jgi:preprotein translocase subunit YajC